MTKGHIGNIFNYFFTLKRNTIGSFLRLRGKNTFVFSLSIVYHRAINRIKQEEVKSRAENYFYEEMQSLIDEPNFYLIEELTTRIQEAVTALPESYKEAVVMHRFKNMSYKEIAGILGVSPKTIDYRIQQALKQLRIELKDYLPLLLPLLVKNV